MDRIAASIKAAAMEAARGYDLSERAYDRLFGQLIALENALGSAAAVYVDEALQVAVMRETRLLDDPFEGLLKSGACIQQMAGVFIPPSDDLDITMPAASGERDERNRYADRTRQVVALLRAIGVHADDLVVYSSARPKGMLRARPYALIEIPRLQKQIAVTDALGEATFVASKPLSLETWSTSTKPQLVEQHGVHRLVYDQDGKWLAELRHILVGDLPRVDPALHAKIPLLDALPLARLTEGAIVRWVKLYLEKEGRFPSSLDGEVWERSDDEWTAVDGLSWDLINASLRYGRRGLQGGGTLARLKKSHGLVHDRAITSKQLTAWIEAFHQKEGRHATTRDRTVWELRDGDWTAVEGENWNALNQALLQGARGLAAYKGMTLPQFRWATTDAAQPFDLSPEMIVSWMKLFHEKEGRYPFDSDEAVWERDDAGGWTQREDVDWVNIHRRIRRGGRGLKEAMSLAEFRQRHLGTVERPPRSQEEIAEWIKVFYEKEGRLPSPSKDKEVWRRLGDEFEVVPGETWYMLNHHLMYVTRNRPRESRLTIGRMGARVLGLQEFAPKEPLSEEKIVRWVQLHYEKCGTYPVSAKTPVWEKDGEGRWVEVPCQTWMGVNAALLKGLRGLSDLKGTTLSQLRAKHGLVDARIPVGGIKRAAESRRSDPC